MFGLYEPVHGSAPTIAGQDIANPLATILTLAMMLRHSFSLEEEAGAIEKAVQKTLSQGYRTSDIMNGPGKSVGTKEMGQLVRKQLT
ncbi:MAG: isocitrate/isopropylmalate family dehydrogenase [Dehalococcoidales bacterium]|nr:isocitrate/isopropylmalate family dehydrogenase [Dehalococcoidales bacterium]